MRYADLREERDRATARAAELEATATPVLLERIQQLELEQTELMTELELQRALVTDLNRELARIRHDVSKALGGGT
jgi:hypothetical protein